MKPIKLIEHTADIGIEVKGATKSALFVFAAKGTIGLVVDGYDKITKTGHTDKVKIRLSAETPEALLVKWLEALLVYLQEKQKVPVNFKVYTFTENEFAAEVTFIEFDPAEHKIKYDVKAVTFHDLKIDHEKGKFITRIVFDV